MFVGMISKLTYVPDLDKHTVRYHDDCMKIQNKYRDSGFSLRKNFPACVEGTLESLVGKLQGIVKQHLTEHGVQCSDFQYSVKYTNLTASGGVFSLLDLENQLSDISFIDSDWRRKTRS